MPEEYFPPYIKSEEDKIRWRELLAKIPSEEDLQRTAVKPPPGWAEKVAELKRKKKVLESALNSTKDCEL